MSDPFVAEIRAVGFNFAPKGWAFCDGQLLPISQNTALFALLGTFYGGDGKSTFALPNLQDSVPVHQGHGQGLSEYYLGQASGTKAVTLLESEMPIHPHQASASIDDAQFQAPAPDRELANSTPGYAYESDDSSSLVTMNPQTLGITGTSIPHNNVQPSVVMNFIIAMQGVFPPRS
jgi:microcystin-dependent protein